MPAVPSDELHKKILALMPEGTEVLSDSSSVRPMVVRLPDGEEAHLYVWTLTAAGAGTGRPEEHKIQLKLPGQQQGERGRIDFIDGGRPVILGYSPELDVFACWEEKHYREFAFNRNVQIPHATMELAAKEGWAVAPMRNLGTGAEVRVASKSARLYELIDASLDADNADLAGDERAHFMQQRGASSDYRQDYSRSARDGELPTHQLLRDGEALPLEPRASAAVNLHIRPRVGMYGAFARLNYKPWFAIAELIDNALQSFLANRDRLTVADGGRRPLQVEVRIEDGILRISDRAAGIARAEFPRAFSPAAPPADASGLSEFGIGLKAAACWFGDLWTVRTTALGEKVERTVIFDVPKIVSQGIEMLQVEEHPTPENEHYTVVEITKLRAAPRSGRTYAKIRDHLASIYRTFLRTGQLELRLVTGSSDESLMFEEPKLLHEPYYKDLDGPSVEWRKDLEVVFEDGRRVWGWAGLLQTASTSKAGFAVLRRGRLIQGSGDETWRPERIFKKPNKYTYQRLVGELYVEGFNVSHTKDGIQWGEHEDRLLDELLTQLDSEPLPLIKQAEGHRVRKGSAGLQPGFGQSAVDTASQALEKRAAAVIEGELGTPLEERPVATEPPPPPRATFATRTFDIRLHGDSRTWRVAIEVVHDRAAEWLDVARHDPDAGSPVQHVTIRVNLDHPFSEQFINEDEASLGPVVRIIAALGLAEVVARESGTKYAGRVRGHLNKILRYALAEREGQTDTDD